jgi:hypothetical protein
MKNEEVLVSFEVEELEKRFEMGWVRKINNEIRVGLGNEPHIY